VARLMEDLVGSTLSGRYRLVSRLAGGGMGEVYRGHDLLLDRPVAVKVLQPSLASDHELVERFKDEARAAARLTHPNVVGVFDWGSADDHTYYMVMEYVAGSDLRDLLVTRGSLEPAQAAEIVAAVCDALAAAHAGGLVHRDVKPENVLIARDGTVKVADFGIAVVADADHTVPGGGIPGTLRYLSPEQAQGYEATWASDVWAAGAVLAELLTGQPPLQGAGADLLHRRASEGPSPPSTVAAGVPAELDAIVVRACALDPAARFEDASYMAHELRRAAIRSLPDAPPVESLLRELTGELHLERPRPEGPVGPPRRGRRLLRALGTAAKIVLVAALLAALALGGVRAAPFWFGPADVAVPDLTGLSRPRAASEAERAGLATEVASRRRVVGQPRGEVISQSPAEGSVEEGTVISLVLSAGPPLQRVPDTVGASRERALERLEGAGLVAATIVRYADAKPGTIVAQSPSGGMIEAGERVELEVSKGPRPRPIPDVSTMSSLQAVRALKRAGFVPVIDKTYSNRAPARAVIGTAPRAGQLIPAGSEVDLRISVGPRFRELEMPDVRGESGAAARAALEELGLRVRVVDSCSGGTIVVESDPIAGTPIRENDAVALFLC
jgi:eukaryotic-like serine/threonine-protein kinase